mgnify:CR=1 FL=1
MLDLRQPHASRPSVQGLQLPSWPAFESQDLDWAWQAGPFALAVAFALLGEMVHFLDSGHEFVGAKDGCRYTQDDPEEQENTAQVVVDWMEWDRAGIVGSY